MRRRLDFVIPDVETARKIEDELLLAKIEERRMHFLAKDGVDMKDLPRATLAQTMDLEHGIELGLVVGAATGAVLGLLIYTFTAAGLVFGVGTVFTGAILGSIAGAWISGMVGSSIPNSRLKKFHETLEAGHILLMVDVPPERVEEIEALVTRNHPEVEDHGVESLPPVFP